MRMLLFGVSGQVGYELNRSLACLGQVIACDRSQLDLSNEQAIADFINTVEPDLMINAAAYTAVDKAEQEAALAYAVNATAPAVIAQLAAEKLVPLIHYSTDYVFNGNNTRPWLETDPTAPLGVYGQSKLAGEKAIMDSGCQHLIFRTSWVYGARRHNFLLTMRRLAKEREQLSVVNDQIGAPTWSRHIADATALVIARSLTEADFWLQHSGLYHLSAAGQTSWYDFAKAIFEEMTAANETLAQLSAIASEQYPALAQRPAYSCLDNSNLRRHFAIQLPDWQHSLKLVMSELV